MMVLLFNDSYINKWKQTQVSVIYGLVMAIKNTFY